ncbi:hypothetical protein ABE276_002392 [Salmonella enterica]
MSMKNYIKTISFIAILSSTIMFSYLPIGYAGGFSERELQQFQEGVNVIHAEASKPGASDQVKALSDTFKNIQRQSQHYNAAKLNEWAYGELAKCKVITESEYQDYFLRFMRSKHPN